MKQRNKEELIEYFIELLNENNLLENIMTNEQIRDKLNYLIKDVTYNSEIGKSGGSWTTERDGKGIVNFDKNNILGDSEKELIVHELLHVLSTTVIFLKDDDVRTRIKEKCGLLISNISYYKNGDIGCYARNTAINEGLIDSLAEQISGVKSGGYNTEKDIYKILSIIIGQDCMLRKAFIQNVTINQEPLELFKEDIIDRYGENLGAELNEEVKRIFTLSDALLDWDRNDNIHGLNEDSKRIQAETREEVYDTLYSMIKKVIENEPDIIKKIDIIKQCRETTLNKKVHENLLNETLDNFLNDNTLEYNEKIEIFEKIQMDIPERIMGKLLFELPESDNLTAQYKLEKYINGVNSNQRDVEVIYRLLVESGKISEEKLSKKSMFSADHLQWLDYKELEEKLEEIKYSRIGNYYEFNGNLYDSKGEGIYDIETLIFDPIEDDEIPGFEREVFSGILEYDKCDILGNNLKAIFENYKKSIENPKRAYHNQVMLKDNILQLKYYSYARDDKRIVEYFKIKPDGTVEKIEGVKRRFTDDMSELDIELQKQTADVSITEMMKETDSMQVALSSKEPRTKENSIGEGNDGK